MTTNESRESMRAVARSPEAFAGYLANIQAHLVGLRSTLVLLAHETQTELRATEVGGDWFFHPWLRARPVEKQLNAIVSALEAAVAATEKAAIRRVTHDQKVAALPGQRAAKALEKANRRIPKSAPVNNSPQQVPPPAKTSYAEPRSIHDLSELRNGGRRSA
ncbi:hypothetical protein ACFW1A_00735 [Kitasatospora sp. NPDC058965]|uniref:hypothetical protein n=1 Tax=Kitasatospora sp. NPDC058965 TaxID=3346682 RepID=UPI0036B25D81